MNPINQTLNQTFEHLKERLPYLKNIIPYYAGLFAIQVVSAYLMSSFLGEFFMGILIPMILNIVSGLLNIAVSLGAILIIGKKENDAQEALKKGLKLFPTAFIAYLILVAIMIPSFLFLMIPAIILGIYFSFTQFVIAFENKKAWDSLKSSMELVKNYWWPVFGRLLLIGILIGIPMAIISGLISSTILAGLASLAPTIILILMQTLISATLGLITLFIVTSFQFMMYSNLRVIKSGSTNQSGTQVEDTMNA